jgi:hypothetical protein
MNFFAVDARPIPPQDKLVKIYAMVGASLVIIAIV